MTIDPKLIAHDIEIGDLWLCCNRSMSINNVCADLETRDLIIAALRAYVPPCQHVWDDKGGRVWWWAGNEACWKRRCVKCGIFEGYKFLVPVEETP